jgi:transcription antitermination protein NusB
MEPLMASPRELRRLAFQTLYQLDARGGAIVDAQSVRDSLEAAEGYTPEERQAAFDLAAGAFESRQLADREMELLAPGWPAHRQPAVDRAILRLAHYEMSLGKSPAKVVVNDAIELAKEFSTDRSPAFVNGLLDKVLKRVAGASDGVRSPSLEKD